MSQSYPISIRMKSRVLWTLIGIGVFFWIAHEDCTTTLPVILGGLIALGLALEFEQRFLSGISGWSNRLLAYPLLGLATGALAMPLSVLSMLVKLSLHSHVPPEYSVAQVIAVLGRTWIWSGAGAMVGTALMLVHWARKNG
jgi:hypothetical protein